MSRQVSIKELKQKMGEDTANKLYEEFAGMTIYIPKKGIEHTQEEKEEIIYNMFYESMIDKKDIAIKMDLSEDRINKILKKTREKWLKNHKKSDENDNEFNN